MQITANLQGIEQAKALLDQLPDKMQRSVLLSLMGKSTKPLIATAKSKLLAYNPKYAKLAKTIGNIVARSRKDRAILYVGPRVKGQYKNTGYIAHWVEYGTKGVKGEKSRRSLKPKDVFWANIYGRIKAGESYRTDQPAYPFMRPAIDQERGNVQRNFEKNISDLLNKEIQKRVARMKK